ncbi:MAG: hypothetical protein KQH79_17840 [Bacteroidetes bacterium]|nr:hypothetical protein [Bacteroidota bacterium]
MKTKGFIYIILMCFIIMFAACEEEHIMTKYTDGAAFIGSGIFKSATEDLTLEIAVTHRSINEDGKAEIELVASDGSPLNAISLDKTMVDFSVSDTVIITASIDHDNLVIDQTFTYTLRFTDKYLQAGYGGSDEYVIEVTKFKPAQITDFVGTWSGTEYYPAYEFTDDISGITIEQKDATTLIVKADSGIPGFMSEIFESWGETFITGYGLEGDIELIINLTNGDITIETGQFWGVTDADYAYWYVGSGSWVGGNSMKLHFELHWDDADFTDGGNESSEIEIKLDE